MFVDENGYKQIDDLIEREKERLKIAVNAKAAAFQNDTNAWHDNAAYEDALEKENGSIMELNRLFDAKNSVKIVDKHNDLTLIDIDDIVTIEMNGDDVFEVVLTGKYLANSRSGEITLNSPLGKSIYKKKVGDVMSFTSHTKTQHSIKILSFKREN